MTFDERCQMIKDVCKEHFNRTPEIVPVKDYIYNDTQWLTSVQNQIARLLPTDGKNQIKLFGHFKDDSSYYLNYFPQWELVKQPNYFGINATDIRFAMYNKIDKWMKQVPAVMHDYLSDFMKTDRFKDLVDEHKYIVNYKKMWESSPFPPTFVTVDAVVVQDGHILLIKRGCNPGKGKYALPGGFLNADEFIFRSAIRELKEETNIDVPTAVLERAFKEVKTFDHPKRSLRGRTITHAHFFKLEGGKPLPMVKADDDASEAMWVPLNELARLEEVFFEDHLGMIEYFIYRY